MVKPPTHAPANATTITRRSSSNITLWVVVSLYLQRLRKIRKSWARRLTSWVRLWTDDPAAVGIIGGVLREDVDADPEAYGTVFSSVAYEETVP